MSLAEPRIYQAESLLPQIWEGPAPQHFSVYGDEALLILDLASCQGLAEAEALAAWLSTLACPVIGIRQPEDGLCRQDEVSACARACDAVVDSSDQAAQLQLKIEDNPVAAASFVDLLRVTEDMPVAHALAVESAVYATLQGGQEYQDWLARQQPAEPKQGADEGPAVISDARGNELRLTLNRPSRLNAMSIEIRDALVEMLRCAALDESLQRLVLQGRGRSFSTGGDLAEFGTVPDAARGHLIRKLSVPGKFLWPLAEKTTVYLHGACVGSGIEFPAFAGHLVADPDTWFQLPEVGMGLIPGAGGCISIARRIGRQRLAWLGLSGKRIRAPQALAWGLVDEIEDWRDRQNEKEGRSG